MFLNRRLRKAKGSPAAVAWGILRDLRVQDFPIDPRRIASELGIALWEKELPGTYDGCLMQVGNAWGILINASIRSEARRKFTIAHEIGHYLLERNTSRPCSLDEQLNTMLSEQEQNTEQTRSQKQAYLLSEQRANRFAVELLMPSPIFMADASALTQVGLPAISSLATQYDTSLTSTGIHYTRLSEHVCAIVFSEGGIIRYFAYSDGFRENKHCFLVNGQPLHPNALATQFTNTTRIGELIDEVPLHYWCKPNENQTNVDNPEDTDNTIIEHSRRTSHTKQVMTFLHLP